MDYLLGSLSTFIAIWFVSYRLKKSTSNVRITVPLYSQSQSFLVTRHSMGAYPITSYDSLSLKTQATEYFDKRHTRIVIYDNFAYWILNQKLYSAPFDGQEILNDSTKEVDTMGMDKVELEQMVFIVDLLTEGNSNDSGSARNS